MPVNKLRILEANLVGTSGHYAELARALAARSEPFFDQIDVVCDVNAQLGSLSEVPFLSFECRIPKNNRLRAEFMELRSCVRGSDPFLVLTARTVDVVMLELAALSNQKIEHARLFFHWPERGYLKKIASLVSSRVRQQALAIAPTPSTTRFLRNSGWRRVVEVPYPALAPAELVRSSRLKRLLVAGAARVNKGIEIVVGLAERMAERGDAMELFIQTTAKRRGGRLGRKEGDCLERLSNCKLQALRMDPASPDRDKYTGRFSGALVLAPYHPIKFADNVSGVALDALLHGAPVVATAGTWHARLVSRFGAGVIMEDWSARSLDVAVAEARLRWDEISTQARRAASILAQEHDPAHMLSILSRGY